jgi:hypothetical protein
MRRRAARTVLVDECEDGPHDAVDAALAVASRGGSLTSPEALRVLSRVQTAIRVVPPDPTIDQIIAAATTSFSGQLVIDRSLLVNSLLDIRLALSIAAAS